MPEPKNLLSDIPAQIARRIGADAGVRGGAGGAAGVAGAPVAGRILVRSGRK